MLDIEICCPSGPGDTGPLAAWLDRLPRDRIERLAIVGKTEGPATLNDYSRDLAQVATDCVIAEAGGGLSARAFRLFSTGCEGIATPVTAMFARLSDGAQSPRSASVGLAIGVARSAPLPAFPRCGPDHIDAAAGAVADAMADAGLRPGEVKLVLLKSPVLMPGSAPPGTDTLARHTGSTGSSRGAAAIGAGVALGEIDRVALGADPVGRHRAHATRAMAFSGIEVDLVEVVVLGERAGGDPRYGLACAQLSDMLDGTGFDRIRDEAGADPDLVFFKAGIAADGRLRGQRTTALSSEWPADKQLRAAASGLIAAHFSTTRAFISGGAEHQAQPGGCLAAALYRRG
jgi:cyanuric acid amidohydrolase